MPFLERWVFAAAYGPVYDTLVAPFSDVPIIGGTKLRGSKTIGAGIIRDGSILALDVVGSVGGGFTSTNVIFALKADSTTLFSATYSFATNDVGFRLQTSIVASGTKLKCTGSIDIVDNATSSLDTRRFGINAPVEFDYAAGFASDLKATYSSGDDIRIFVESARCTLNRGPA